jgi:hypothetical protein
MLEVDDEPYPSTQIHKKNMKNFLNREIKNWVKNTSKNHKIKNIAAQDRI